MSSDHRALTVVLILVAARIRFGSSNIHPEAAVRFAGCMRRCEIVVLTAAGRIQRHLGALP
jgi:hypothetical protein